MNAVAGIDSRVIDTLGIRRLVSDSRAVRAGDTFVAYPGALRTGHDGRDFIGQAIQSGASSVLWDATGFPWKSSWRLGHAKRLAVPQLRHKVGIIASYIYGRPSSRLWTMGITGTNGKTSCSQWIAQALCMLDRRCAVMGTLGNGFPGVLETGVNTTPDAAWLHGKLRDWNREGAKAVAMEVSSHGLEQGRVAGVEFDVALFTNLTRDHLDYHGTMANYRRAKARLFEWETLKWSVFNFDDRFGAELARRSRRGCVLGYGFNRSGAASRMPCVRGYNLRLGLNGVSFDVATPWGAAHVRSRVLGRFNASNLLGALAVLLASNTDLNEAVRVLAATEPVAGRAERFGGGAAPLVVVDYAHTPDALEKILRTLREIGGPEKRARRSSITCVFGCGGDRDRGKRAMMGRIATRCADRVIVTSDNPRSESPMAIIADILQGATRECVVIEDRKQAVHEAIVTSARGDIVVIAGKGHEPYQEIRGVRYPYSDAQAVRAALGSGTAVRT
ncbi:MAG: UDP-N-acetylmuramoyl-L-alanyl-D-glutamate--2,6-diaminopimelate ligase [Burkholderiales bacterium]